MNVHHSDRQQNGHEDKVSNMQLTFSNKKRHQVNKTLKKENKEREKIRADTNTERWNIKQKKRQSDIQRETMEP